MYRQPLRGISVPPRVFSPPTPKNPRKFPKLIIYLVILLIVGGGLYYWFFNSSFFNVKNVNFEGLNLENFDTSGIKGQNILTVNIDKIKSDISQANPNVGEIKVVRGLPDTLKIQIKPYQAALVWRTTDRQYLTNKEGTIIGEVQGATDLPIVQDNKDISVQLGKTVATDNFINFIRDLNSKFSDTTGFKIVIFEINDTVFQVNADTDQGWFVKFDTTRSATDQLEALKKLLAEHKDEIREYVDVRVEGKVFYK